MRQSLVLVTLESDVKLWSVVQEDAQEESGWKQVHGDVFRPPQSGMLLSVFLGQGTQIFIMTFITLCKENPSLLYFFEGRSLINASFLWTPAFALFTTVFKLFFLVLACLGFLSPANRGALMTCAVVLWVLLGTPAGYVSARLYKSKV